MVARKSALGQLGIIILTCRGESVIMKMRVEGVLFEDVAVWARGGVDGIQGLL
jgi:hypothetical protein